MYQALSKQGIRMGGKWEPSDCQPKHHVAILIPYRDREEHLNLFLLNMHPIFARQKLSYGIYLIEPVKGISFNRGILFNIGFNESNHDAHNTWQCHSFHDVSSLENRYFKICLTSCFFYVIFFLKVDLISESTDFFA